MGTHPIFESDFDCLTEWPFDWPSFVKLVSPTVTVLDISVTVTSVTQTKSLQLIPVPSVIFKLEKFPDGRLTKTSPSTLFSLGSEDVIWPGDGSTPFQSKSTSMVKSVVMVLTSGAHLVPSLLNSGFSLSSPCTCSPGKKVNITDTRSTTGNPFGTAQSYSPLFITSANANN